MLCSINDNTKHKSFGQRASNLIANTKRQIIERIIEPVFSFLFEIEIDQFNTNQEKEKWYSV
jgi:hypothetical protein